MPARKATGDLESLLAIKVTIRDRDAIDRLQVDAVLRYLAAHRSLHDS